MREEKFISYFNSKKIGDDGAVVNLEGKKVIASDSFFEDVHFKKEWMSYKDIAIKASLVNVSDLVVMNAKPKYALLNVAMGELNLKELKELALGFKVIAKKFNYEIIGGDTISSDKLGISITLIGDVKKEIKRKAKIGEFVAFTGDLGSSYKELKRGLRGKKVKGKFKRPIIRDKFFYEISKYVTAAMDISDGLIKDLERISIRSNVNFKFLKKLSKLELISPEEYEILFSFNKKYLRAIKRIAKKHRVKINIFAKTKRGRFKAYKNDWH